MMNFKVQDKNSEVRVIVTGSDDLYSLLQRVYIAYTYTKYTEY